MHLLELSPIRICVREVRNLTNQILTSWSLTEKTCQKQSQNFSVNTRKLRKQNKTKFSFFQIIYRQLIFENNKSFGGINPQSQVKQFPLFEAYYQLRNQRIAIESCTDRVLRKTKRGSIRKPK